MSTCNLDSRGRGIRLGIGLVTLAVAVALAALLLTGLIENLYLWFAVLGCLIGGGFAVYEGWSGWCALRAMGVRTPF